MQEEGLAHIRRGFITGKQLAGDNLCGALEYGCPNCKYTPA
jgi:hypothetical protein